MKEFSSLNGYAVKDKTARTAIMAINEDLDYLDNFTTGYVTPQMYGGYGDGAHDDTLAIQTAINTGKWTYRAPFKGFTSNR